MYKIIKRSVGLILGLGLCVFSLTVYRAHQFSPIIFTQSSLKRVDSSLPTTALVLGAGIQNNSTPSLILYDRIKIAADLYKQKIVNTLFLTGDSRTDSYDEVAVMKKTALSLGVPEKDLILDNFGFRTYESCNRAIHVFGIKSAIVVTQAFHLPRALYLFHHLGGSGIGVCANYHNYPIGWQVSWFIREIGATVKSWIDIHFK